MRNDLLLVDFDPSDEWDGAAPFSSISQVVLGMEEFVSTSVSAINGPGGVGESTPRFMLVSEPEFGSIRFKFKLEIYADIKADVLRQAPKDRNPGLRDAISLLSDSLTIAPFIASLCFGAFGIYARTTGSRHLDKPVERFDVAADAVAKQVANPMLAAAKKLQDTAERSGCKAIRVQAPGCAPVDLIGSSRRRRGLIGSQYAGDVDHLKSITELSGFARLDKQDIRVELDAKEYKAFHARNVTTSIPTKPTAPVDVIMVWGSRKEAPQGVSRVRAPVTGDIMVRGRFITRSDELTPLDDVPLQYETMPIFFVSSSNDGWR